VSERRERVDAANRILSKVRDEQRAVGEFPREEILLSVIASMMVDLVELTMEGQP
jgi:hypothetical protein